MPKIVYRSIKFREATRALIERCNTIIAEYTAQGFQLTLRQLYYQLVSRGFIENNYRVYKNVGATVVDARLAGLIDWEAIEDRTRNLVDLAHWDTPADLVAACAKQFHVDMWVGQKFRPEVWIEKEALVGLIEGACKEFDVPVFAGHGYISASEMWVAANRFERGRDSGQTPIIFYLGDHDPSGKDMTRDITDRLELLMGGVRIERLALNMNQVEQYNLPPAPAKTKDSRRAAYVAEFGHDEVWELDALEPTVLVALIRSAIAKLIEPKKWAARLKLESAGRKRLRVVAKAV